jgi:hypothetical protein
MRLGVLLLLPLLLPGLLLLLLPLVPGWLLLLVLPLLAAAAGVPPCCCCCCALCRLCRGTTTQLSCLQTGDRHQSRWCCPHCTQLKS